MLETEKNSLNTNTAWYADPFYSPPKKFVFPKGSTVEQIVNVAIKETPTLSEFIDYITVKIGADEILKENWAFVKPKEGSLISVICEPLGGGGGGNKVLSTIAMIAVVALTAWVGGAFGAAALEGSSLATATGLSFAAGSSSALFAAMGVSIVGGLAVNALFGPDTSRGKGIKYDITGVGNQSKKDEPCPIILGTRRVFPPLAATTWTEVDGENVYVRMLLFWTVGRCSYTDLKLGETPITDYEDYTIQDHLSPNDSFPSLYNKVVREDTISQQLYYQVPVIKRTRTKTTKISIDLGWPSGMYSPNYKNTESVSYTILYKDIDATAWTAAPVGSSGVVTITKKTRKTFYVNYNWEVTEGQYDVKITRTEQIDDIDNEYYGKMQTTGYWIRLRSFGSGSPILNYDNFSFTAIKFKATKQINGTIDNINAVVTSVVPKWNATSEEFDDSNYNESENPAELFNWYATSGVTAYPQTNIDTTKLGEWHTECTTNDWKCDYIAESGTMEDVLQTICASGQGLSPLWEDGNLSVAIDDERDSAVALFSARNVWGFQGEILYPKECHAVQVKFYDSTLNYEQQTRTIYADGYSSSNATKIESIDLPYKTDPAEAYIFGWRYLAARTLRPEIYTFNTTPIGLTVRLGDRVDVAHHRMSVGIQGTHIKSLVLNESNYVTGVVLDDYVTMESGNSYVLRIQRGSGIGLYNITNTETTTNTLTLSSTIAQSSFGIIGNHAIFGISGVETLSTLCLGIEINDDKSASLYCIPYAPGLLENGGTIPAWDPEITSRQTTKEAITTRALSSDDQAVVTDDQTSVSLSVLAETSGVADDAATAVTSLQAAQAELDTTIAAIDAAQERSDEIFAQANAILAEVAIMLADKTQSDAQILTKTSEKISASVDTAKGQLSASIEETRTIAADATSIVAQRATTIEAALTGYLTSGAVSAGITSASTAYATPLATQTARIDTLASVFGNNTGSAAFNVYTTTAASYATATAVFALQASDGTNTKTAGWKASVGAISGTYYSFLEAYADKLLLTADNTYFRNSSGTIIGMFSDDGLNVSNLIAPGAMSSSGTTTSTSTSSYSGTTPQEEGAGVAVTVTTTSSSKVILIIQGSLVAQNTTSGSTATNTIEYRIYRRLSGGSYSQLTISPSLYSWTGTDQKELFPSYSYVDTSPLDGNSQYLVSMYMTCSSSSQTIVLSPKTRTLTCIVAYK
jgi:hypothetical protein